MIPRRGRTSLLNEIAPRCALSFQCNSTHMVAVGNYLGASLEFVEISCIVGGEHGEA